MREPVKTYNTELKATQKLADSIANYLSTASGDFGGPDSERLKEIHDEVCQQEDKINNEIRKFL